MTDYRLSLAFGLLKKFEAYQHEVEQYAAIAQFCPIPVFVTSHDHTAILFVNPAYIELTGCDVDMLQREGWTYPIHPDDRERVSALWEKFIADRQPMTLTERFRNVLTGEIVACSIVVNFVPNNGMVGYIIPEVPYQNWHPRQEFRLQPAT